MRFLVSVALVGAVLAALPARASEVGLILDRQVGSSQSVGFYNFDAVKPSGYGIRGSYTVLNFNAAEVGLTATYHPTSKTDLVVNGFNSGRFGSEYVAVGAQVDWKSLVNLHAGIDIRRERLTTESAYGVVDGSTTFTRPWLTAGVGYTFNTGSVKPIVGFEVAIPMTKQGNVSMGSSADDIRKSLAPDYQIGLYGGIRF
jgi:hypothetical protein